VRPTVLTVGKPSRGWSQTAVEDYERRLRRWDGVDSLWVKAELYRGDVDAVRDAEASRVRGHVHERDVLVLMDERGRDLDTHEFTSLIENARINSVQRLLFAIGGAYGHAHSLAPSAQHVIRLSSMVLNHEVARVVLYEQIYRAYTLIHGVPYHH
jgi:23S rRNA (pseudouridine1915-N3)-methyltransferase